MKGTIFSFFTVYLVLVLAGGIYSQEFSDENYDDVRPPYIPLSRMRYLSNNNPVFLNKLEILRLTSDEKKQLVEEIKKLPKFSPYLFSGCHDRSHASYQLLLPILQNKTYKAWIFSPKRHTSSVSGVIKLKSNEEFEKRVDWGYHVALFFYDGNEKLVLDQALSPNTLITIDQWFSKMKIPVGSFWTTTLGNLYLFNSTEEIKSPKYYSPANQDIFNGWFQTYQTDTNRFLSSNLARDDVGHMLMTQEICNGLKQFIEKPGQLGKELKSGNLPTGCETVLSFYNQRFKYWKDLLEP